MTAEAKTTQSAEATKSARVITIVTTRGEKRKINFEGKEWKDLKNLLEKGGKDISGNSFPGYSLSSMKCVESSRRTTLEHPQAVVPDGDFNLFLMPYKSKSGGGISRSELYVQIKNFISGNESAAKTHFGNYTQKKTSELEQLVDSYRPGTTKAISKEKSAAISDVVSSVKSAKAEGQSGEDILSILQGLSLEEKVDLMIQMLLDIRSTGGTVSSASSAGVTDTASSAPTESPEQAEARKKKEEEDRLKKEEEDRKRKEEEEEDRRLQAEMGDLMSGLDDVRR